MVKFISFSTEVHMNRDTVHTLTELIVQAAEHYKDTPALSFVDDDPWSYDDIYQAARHLAADLVSRGIHPGDRVALLSESSPYWGIAYFAGVLAGAVMVPILPDFHANEIETILRHSEASGLLVSKRTLQKITENTHIPFSIIIDEEIPRPERVSSAETETFTPAAVDEESTVSIIYTSGTTGISKGVMLTHKNIIANAFAAEKIPQWTEETCGLSILPLAHTYEFTIGFIIMLLKGATVYYLRRPPSTSVLLPALAKVRPHVVLSVPLLIEKIYAGIRKTKIDPNPVLRVLYKVPLFRKLINRAIGKGLMKTFGNRLHFFGIGGAPLAAETERFLREARFPFAMGYGLTETSPLIAGGRFCDIPFRSTGNILDSVECRLDLDASPADDGEVLVRGPSIMKGYYKDPEKTAEVISPDGWFRTGDLGKLDRHGTLTITGRVKNMILSSNGENIYPEQIESIINQDRFVVESLVMQDKKSKNLIARVHLDYESFIETHKESKIVKELHNLERYIKHQEDKNDKTTLQEQINTYMEELKRRVNRELAAFSRIDQFIEEKEPFIRTPTKKIKRYLYEG